MYVLVWPHGSPTRILSRLEALSDGVFAIAITLLILNVHLPSNTGPVAPQLSHLIAPIATYVLSFVIVGTYWVAHHSMLGEMRNPGRPLWWPNLLALMVVAFMPFPAGVLALHPYDAAAPAIVRVDTVRGKSRGCLLERAFPR